MKTRKHYYGSLQKLEETKESNDDIPESISFSKGRDIIHAKDDTIKSHINLMKNKKAKNMAINKSKLSEEAIKKLIQPKIAKKINAINKPTVSLTQPYINEVLSHNAEDSDIPQKVVKRVKFNNRDILPLNQDILKYRRSRLLFGVTGTYIPRQSFLENHIQAYKQGLSN